MWERRDAYLDTDECHDMTIDVKLVVQQRVIELASDLGGCLHEVALEHYRHHAALQAEALAGSGRALQTALAAVVATQSDSGVLKDRLRASVEQWLDQFQSTLPSVRAAADSSSELDTLRDACST